MIVEECAVKCHDVVGVTAVHNLELTHDSFPHLLLRLDVYDLAGVSTHTKVTV
jgi:hypothetical protein